MFLKINTCIPVHVFDAEIRSVDIRLEKMKVHAGHQRNL